MTIAALILVPIAAAGVPSRTPSWADLVDAVKTSPAAAPGLKQFIKQAREVAALEAIRRVYKYQDVGKHRTWLDGRAVPLEPEIQQTFALAMSDHSAGVTLARELPMLAAAYRLTGEQVLKNRAIEQLAEVATWSPLQRPGWTCYERGRRLPKDGKDGAWLATGTLIRAIADALDILPSADVPVELRTRLHKLLETEIDSIVDDWRTKRTWFIRSDNAITNQWVLPTEGLVRACLVVGTEDHRDAYELGVANMLKALDSHGRQGEFEEGIGYAQFTVGSMLATARAMGEKGDLRALQHPFLQRFPIWAAHHMQPGHTLINCFDAGNAGYSTGLLRPLFALSAVCIGSPTALWGLEHADPASYDLPMLLAHALPPVDETAAPPLYAAYERATQVNWRSSWQEDATGIWIRGGHPLDQHDHQDRGHVSFTCRGKPLLIETGTPSYHDPTLSWCQSCEGHNVLQIGSAPAKKRPAPISVEKLDSAGGHVVVDGTQCYDGLESWRRDVEWDADSLTVTDEVKLQSGSADTVTFRWHLATAADARIDTEGDRWIITWPNGRIVISGTPSLEVNTEKLPEFTLSPYGSTKEHKHTCVIIRTRDKVSGFSLRTRVTGSHPRP